MVKTFFKKPLVRWVCLLLLVLGSYRGVVGNLKRHSLYYLSQSEYDKTKLPEYVLLAENYEYLTFEGLDGKTYRDDDFFQGVDQIIYEGSDGISWRLATKYNDYRMGRFFQAHGSGASSYYTVGEDGVLWVNTSWSLIDIEADESSIRTVRQMIAPIMATQQAPTINLQWVFELVYHQLLSP